jgi:hypothetical protein
MPTVDDTIAKITLRDLYDALKWWKPGDALTKLLILAKWYFDKKGAHRVE